ncbi:MAG: hypothetical protein ABL961_04710 [Vicinamibacterales bacterium]
MRLSTRILVLQMVVMLVGGLGTLTAQEPSARQATPSAPVDPLIGTWSLNLAKSQYPGTPPKAVTRTFDYTLDGMILVTYETTNAQGNKSFTHWFLGLDGKEHPEFGRSTGATPIWFLSTKIIDTHTKEITDRRVVAPGQRQQIINYTFVVSPDGKTFTSTARSTNAQGEPTVTVQVYDRVF